MRNIPIYNVDAFTSEAFLGNPAAVCILEEPIEDRLMQLIAKEMNLSETAFIQSMDGKSIAEADRYSLRWFTPKTEVDLCGHATIAASQILFEVIGVNAVEINYETRGGRLTARKIGEWISLKFPIDEPSDISVPHEVMEALGIRKYENAIIGKNTKKLVIQVNEESEVLNLSPNFEKMKNLRFSVEVKGIGVTCRGNKNYDFITRYFNPWAGVNEDPVTGSVHTVLAAYWSKLLNKNEMKAHQASEREGELLLRVLPGNKVELAGKAVIILKGELYIK